MKFSSFTLFLALLARCHLASAFVPPNNPAFASITTVAKFCPQQQKLQQSTTSTTAAATTASSSSATQLQLAAATDFGSDFGSAMPEKPTQSTEEYLRESAGRAISSIRGSLADGVDPPKELEELDELIKEQDGVTVEAMSMKIYELMIERGMTYDEDPETGILTPTEFDIQSNLDVPEVKHEFDYMYRYGMTLIAKGLVGVDNVKKIVQQRLIRRTGLSPEEFDEWLGF